MAQKSSTPRWLWWFLGCSLVVGFIVLCSCGIGGFFAYRFYQQTAAPPLTFAEFQKLVPDFPIYPNAQFDETMSNLPSHRMLRGKFGQVEKQVFIVPAVFRTHDSQQKVLNWYRRELQRLGWEELELTQQMPEWVKHLTAATGFSTHFKRGGNLVLFQGLPSSGFQVHCFVTGLPDWEMQRLQERVKENPNDGEVWTRLAWGHFCLGQWQDAKNAAQKALANVPEKAQTKLLLAMVLAEMGEFQRALSLVEELVKKPLAPMDERLAWGIYAACLGKVGRLKEAEQALTKILASRFGDTEVKATILVARGSIRWKQGRISEALADYESAYKQDPSHWRILVQTYMRVGKRDKAIEVIKAMAKTDKFAQYVLRCERRAVWLGIYRAHSPSYMSGRWVKNSGIKGDWAIGSLISRHSKNWAVLEDTLIFAVNGKTFKNEREFMTMVDELCIRSKPDDKVIFSVWHQGKIEQVIAQFEPFLK